MTGLKELKSIVVKLDHECPMCEHITKLTVNMVDMGPCEVVTCKKCGHEDVFFKDEIKKFMKSVGC